MQPAEADSDSPEYLVCLRRQARRKKLIGAEKVTSGSQAFQRFAAFRENIADVREGRFFARCHLVEMQAPLIEVVVRALGDIQD